MADTASLLMAGAALIVAVGGVLVPIITGRWKAQPEMATVIDNRLAKLMEREEEERKDLALKIDKQAGQIEELRAQVISLTEWKDAATLLFQMRGITDFPYGAPLVRRG